MMTDKNYPNIAREILDRNEFEPMSIQVAPKHLKRIESAAEGLGLSVPDTITFMFYCYVNDIELHAKLESQKLMN